MANIVSISEKDICEDISSEAFILGTQMDENGIQTLYRFPAKKIGGVSPEQTKEAVDRYLDENPVEGTPGQDGADGFSPTATVEQTETGAIISITDKDGTTTVTITNGKDGAKGEQGDPYTLTEEDKTTIVNSVLEALPAAEGVEY